MESTVSFCYNPGLLYSIYSTICILTVFTFQYIYLPLERSLVTISNALAITSSIS